MRQQGAAMPRWKRRSWHQGPRRQQNCLGGKGEVELSARQRRHDRDQSSHPQAAEFGGQLVQGVMHTPLLVLRTCSRQSTGQRARTWWSHDPGQPPEPRTGGENLAGLQPLRSGEPVALLLGQYGDQKGVVDHEHARESGRLALSQIGVSLRRHPVRPPGRRREARPSRMAARMASGMSVVALADAGRPKSSPALPDAADRGSLRCRLQRSPVQLAIS